MATRRVIKRKRKYTRRFGGTELRKSEINLSKKKHGELK